MASGGPGKKPSWIRHMLCPYWEIFREGSSPAARGQTSAISTNPRMECVQRHDFIASPLDILPPIDAEKPQLGVNRNLTEIVCQTRRSNQCRVGYSSFN